jgi:hypothetical protein
MFISSVLLVYWRVAIKLCVELSSVYFPRRYRQSERESDNSFLWWNARSSISTNPVLPRDTGTASHRVMSLSSRWSDCHCRNLCGTDCLCLTYDNGVTLKMSVVFVWFATHCSVLMLKIDLIRSSETSVAICETAQCHRLEGHNRQVQNSSVETR